MKRMLITKSMTSKNHSRLASSTILLKDFFMAHKFIVALVSKYIPNTLVIDYQVFNLLQMELNSPYGIYFP